MQLNILNKEEQTLLAQKENLSGVDKLPKYIDERLRNSLPLRSTRPITSSSKNYQRRQRQRNQQMNLFD